MPGEPEYTAINYEAITVGTTVVDLAEAVTSGGATRRGQRALVTVESQQIRFRYDGTAPTSTEGHVAGDGDQIEIVGYDNINNFRAIRHSAATADATIRVTLEGF